MALITIKEIEEKATEFKDVFDRNDLDMDLYFSKKFEMLGFDSLPIPKIINLTLPDLAIFAVKTIGILQAAEPQIVAESYTMDDELLRKIERCAIDLSLSADEYRGVRGLPPVYLYKVEQSCVRGRTATQVLNRKEKGKTIIDHRPIDTRYHIYDMGSDGMNWSAYSVRHSRSFLKQKFGAKGDIGEELSAIVWDVYDRTRHYVYWADRNGNDLIHDTAHPFKYEGKGYVPVVVKKVPSGSMLSHPDALVHEGESIFALARDLNPEMNRMATVLHNLTMAAFFGARQYASEGGEAKETEAIPFGLGVVVSIEKGGGYSLIPVNDIKNATRLEYSMLEQRMQRATLPNIDYGSLSFSLSAVAIGRLKESKDIVFVPRLKNLEESSQEEVRMAFRQLIEIGGKIELGEEGHKRKYDTADLKGEYSLKLRYFAEAKEEKLAAITEAQSLGTLVSEDYKMREIIRVKDPDGENDKKAQEAGAKADPALQLYDRVHSLIDRADEAIGKSSERYDMQARMTLNSLIMILKQRSMQQGLTFPQNGGGAGAGQQERPMKLLGGGEGGGAGRTTKTEEQRANEEMDEEERIGRLAETGRRGRPTPALVEGGQ